GDGHDGEVTIGYLHGQHSRRAEVSEAQGGASTIPRQSFSLDEKIGQETVAVNLPCEKAVFSAKTSPAVERAGPAEKRWFHAGNGTVIATAVDHSGVGRQ